MPYLLADASVSFDVEKFITNQGLAVGLILMLCLMIWRYAPRIIDTHVNFVSAIKDQGERSLRLQAAQTDILSSQATTNNKTHDALLHHANALLELAMAQGPEVAAKVRPHVEAIRRSLS